MTLRQFFNVQHWWGKLLGGFFGFLIGHSVGAVFGVLIGNIFDKGLAEHFSRSHWRYHQERRKHVQTIFFRSTFAVMGYVAKADGRVSEQEIAIAKQIMAEMRLSSKQKEEAKQYFTQGKQASFKLTETLRELLNACHDNRELIKLFIDIQYQAASIESFSEAKIHALNTIFKQLGFAPLYKQNRFYEDFSNGAFNNSFNYSDQNTSDTHNKKSNKQNNQYDSSEQHYHYQHHGNYSSLDHAYALLEVSSKSTKPEVKRAYRRLISRNHPDKLIAQGLPEEMIKLANRKTQQITKAYQQICISRGW